jgi:hypothetical protein
VGHTNSRTETCSDLLRMARRVKLASESVAVEDYCLQVCDTMTFLQMFLDIIHRPVYISKHNVPETGFCLRLQVPPTQLGPVDRACFGDWILSPSSGNTYSVGTNR